MSEKRMKRFDSREQHKNTKPVGPQPIVKLRQDMDFHLRNSSHVERSTCRLAQARGCWVSLDRCEVTFRRPTPY